MTSTFLGYSVSTETRPRHPKEGRYIVTADYVEGYEVLSYHVTKHEADLAVKRYEAADKRRAR